MGMTLAQACNMAQSIEAIEADRQQDHPRDPYWEVWSITRVLRERYEVGYVVRVACANDDQPCIIREWGEWRRILHNHWPEAYDENGEYYFDPLREG